MNGNESCQEPEESVPQSFIIKIQNNGDAAYSNPAQWRIQIIHVMTGKQVVFENIENIKTFIWPFLRELNVDYQPDWLKTNV
ncbi:MAG: hypothetical protein KC421_05495 [Anaerolineales bacterium]|nr:hypothetical protein [Anaerolineales bacterium]